MMTQWDKPIISVQRWKNNYYCLETGHNGCCVSLSWQTLLGMPLKILVLSYKFCINGSDLILVM